MKNIEVGDKITFDGNIYGVTPRIKSGVVIKIGKSIATSGCKAENMYQLQNEFGKFWIDEIQVIDK